MNDLLICTPPDPQLCEQAAAFFARPNQTITHLPNCSVGFFGSSSIFPSSIEGNIYVCGHVLAPEETAQILKQKRLSDLDGVFVLAQVMDQEVHIVNDMGGFYSLYKYEADGKTIFSTSLDFLALHIPQKTIDWQAWADLFTYSTPFEDRTLFNEIKLIPKAQSITIGKGVETETYDDYFTWEQQVLPLEEWTARFHEALTTTFEKIGKFNASIAVPLSGGMDSRLFASTLARFQKVDCFTTTKDVGEFGDSRETILAKQVCKTLDGNFHEVGLTKEGYRKHFHNLLLNTNFQTAIHSWYGNLMDMIPPKYNMILDGLADAAFRVEYMPPAHLRWSEKGQWNHVEKGLGRLYHVLLNDRSTKGEEFTYFKPEIQNTLKARKKNGFSIEFARMPKNVNITLNMLVNIRCRRLLGTSVFQILHQRFTVVSPYLSRDVFRLLMRTPVSEKQEQRLMWAYYNQYLPHVASLPCTSESGWRRKLEMIVFTLPKYIPKLLNRVVIYQKPKMVKTSLQFSEDTAEWFMEMLKSAPLSPFMNDFEAFEKMLQTKNTVNRIDILGRILQFELWYRRYFDGNKTIYN